MVRWFSDLKKIPQINILWGLGNICTFSQKLWFCSTKFSMANVHLENWILRVLLILLRPAFWWPSFHLWLWLWCSEFVVWTWVSVRFQLFLHVLAVMNVITQPISWRADVFWYTEQSAKQQPARVCQTSRVQLSEILCFLGNSYSGYSST